MIVAATSVLAPDALGGEQFWWFVCRATGLVGWGLLVASMLWGVALAIRSQHPWVRPGWTFAVHRWLGGLTVVTVGVHLGALVADDYVTFTLVDVLVPFASDYRPLGVALGVTSLWLLLVVQFSSRVLRRLPRSWWRILHRTSYVLILLVTIHAALVGTDAFRGLYVAAAVALVVLPAVALLVRLEAVRRSRRRARRLSDDGPRVGDEPVPMGADPVPARPLG